MFRKKVIYLALFTNLIAQGVYLPDTYIDNEAIEVFSVTKNINEISHEQLRDNKGKDIYDVLNTLPSVNIMGEKIDIRGMGEGTNSKLYIDGIGQNSFDMSPVNLKHINLGQVSKVEVLPGAGSVLYGDGAVGGVINIETLAKSSHEVENNILISKDSFDGDMLELSAGTMLFDDKVFFQTNYSQKETVGYRKNSYEDNENLEVVSKYIINPYEFYTLTLGKLEYEYGLPGSITKGQDREESNYLDDFARGKQKNYGFSYDNTYDSHLNYYFDMNYVEKEYYSETNFWGKSTRETEGNRLFLRPKLVYNYGFASSFLIAYDYSLERSKVTSDYGSGKSSTDNKKDTNALYFYNTYATDLFDIVSGMRYEKGAYSIDNKSYDFDNIAFDIGTKYYYAVEGNLYANLSTAYRTPNIDELAYSSNELKEQKSYNLDFGIAENRGNNTILVSFFGILTEDEIFFDPNGDNGFGTNSNLEGYNLRLGAEYSNERRYERLTFIESLVLMDSEVLSGDYKGKKVPGVSPISAKLHASYELFEDFKLWTSGRYSTDYYHYGDYDNEYEKVDYSLIFDMGLEYVYYNMEVFAGIDNITDQEYYDYAGYSNGSAYYYPGQGRRYYLGLKANF